MATAKDPLQAKSSDTDKMLSARFELAIFRVSGERINQLSHESGTTLNIPIAATSTTTPVYVVGSV
jgi:hypothetical protein